MEIAFTAYETKMDPQIIELINVLHIIKHQGKFC
jgi:hypothetical protein